MSTGRQSKEELFPVGKVVGFRGLRGEVKIRPSTNSPEILLDIKTVSIRLPDGRNLTASVGSVRLDKRMLSVNFEGYADRTAVELLEDAEIFVSRDQLSDLEEEQWWVDDLVGLKVFTTSGAFVGSLLSIIDSGNQLLEISTGDGDKTILVPFVKELVPLVDPGAGRIEIHDIPGLLEPQ
jgi:16S rRNA processing protein RimM